MINSSAEGVVCKGTQDPPFGGVILVPQKLEGCSRDPQPRSREQPPVPHRYLRREVVKSFKKL
jgi:hypothetical protein